jgi:hypothetical protein
VPILIPIGTEMEVLESLQGVDEEVLVVGVVEVPRVVGGA